MGRNHKNLNNNLEEIRKSAGMTQLELSESADVSRKSINAIENGIYVPSTGWVHDNDGNMGWGKIWKF